MWFDESPFRIIETHPGLLREQDFHLRERNCAKLREKKEKETKVNFHLFRMFSARVARSLSTSAPVHKKVGVLGAAGGIGQPLALLLKVD